MLYICLLPLLHECSSAAIDGAIGFFGLTSCWSGGIGEERHLFFRMIRDRKDPVFVLYAIRYLLSATGKDETFRSEHFGTKMSWKEHDSLLGVFGSFVKKRKSACALCYNSYRTVPYWMEYILRMHTRCLHIVACCSHSSRSQCIMMYITEQCVKREWPQYLVLVIQ